MTHTNHDERLEQEAMDQLARANPVVPNDENPNADALYQRITSGAGASGTPSWTRRAALAVGGLAAVAVVAVASVAMLGGAGNARDDGQVAADPSTDDPGAGGFAGTCLAYSEDELRLREFAFRGRAEDVNGGEVTFAVEEWYAGDRGSEVTLELDSSLQSEIYNDFTFAEGEEYLVSGDGEFAWGCGYTRPFNDDLANQWVAALSGEQQPIQGGEAASCAFGYSPATLAERDHAFDGTIVAVGEGVGPGGIEYPEITFEVTESFNGADAGTVTLLGSGLDYGYNPDYGVEEPRIYVGGRYLVAGDAEFAWGCGFTQTYGESEAQVWRAVFDR